MRRPLRLKNLHDCIRRSWPARAAGKPTSQDALAAVAALEAAAGINNGQQPWSDIQRCAALAAARILLEHTDDGFAKAERLLAPALKQARDAPSEWTASAEACS